MARGYKTGGRRKGTPNKATADLRAFVAKLVAKHRKQIEADLAAIDPYSRLKIIERLMQYVLPKMQAVEADLGLPRGDRYDNMTDEELQAEARRLMESITNP